MQYKGPKICCGLISLSERFSLKGHCNQIYQVYFPDEKHRVLFLQHYTDINKQAKMHQAVYYQHFYLLKCMFLLQTGRK